MIFFYWWWWCCCWFGIFCLGSLLRHHFRMHMLMYILGAKSGIVFVKLRTIGNWPALSLSRSLVQGLSPFKRVNSPCQFSITCKLSKLLSSLSTFLLKESNYKKMWKDCHEKAQIGALLGNLYWIKCASWFDRVLWIARSCNFSSHFIIFTGREKQTKLWTKAKCNLKS